MPGPKAHGLRVGAGPSGQNSRAIHLPPSEMPRSENVVAYEEVIETILEAYRGREVAPIVGFSLSQQNGYSCSQMLSQSHSSRVWITPSCRDLIEKIPASELHMLIREV